MLNPFDPLPPIFKKAGFEQALRDLYGAYKAKQLACVASLQGEETRSGLEKKLDDFSQAKKNTYRVFMDVVRRLQEECDELSFERQKKAALECVYQWYLTIPEHHLRVKFLDTLAMMFE